jgi:5'-3' exonuclease
MLMLLDSAGLYFRAFHGSPESITAPDGTPVNAARGFLDMTAALVAARSPDGLVACWDDDWRPQWRVELLPSYKAHRVAPDGGQDEPASLGAQVEILVEVLAALGIPRVGAAGFEADDVMATLARRHAARGEAVEVVTGDRDMLQLVDDAQGIRVLYVGRGIRRMEVLDEAAVQAQYEVSPQQYADLALLRGDPSDGLPGIPGVGARTAADLLVRFGDLEGILAAAADPGSGIRPGVAAALREGAEYLRRAERVVRAAEVPLPEVDVRLPRTPADPDALALLAQRWGLGAPIRRLQAALAAVPQD